MLGLAQRRAFARARAEQVHPVAEAAIAFGARPLRQRSRGEHRRQLDRPEGGKNAQITGGGVGSRVLAQVRN